MRRESARWPAQVPGASLPAPSRKPGRSVVAGVSSDVPAASDRWAQVTDLVGNPAYMGISHENHTGEGLFGSHRCPEGLRLPSFLIDSMEELP